jgi:uncharacterized protein YqeY
MGSSTAAPLRSAMQTALSAAMKNQDRVAVNAIRSALAAITNAEAVDESHAPAAEPGTIAGGVSGLGRGEVPRRTITEHDARQIVKKVVAERQEAATQYDELNRHDDASRLRQEIAVLERFVTG